jgi:hypothetical protein
MDGTVNIVGTTCHPVRAGHPTRKWGDCLTDACLRVASTEHPSKVLGKGKELGDLEQG